MLTNQKTLFAADKDDSSIWTLVESEEPLSDTENHVTTIPKRDPLAAALTRAIEACAVPGTSSAHFEDLCDYIHENWALPVPDMTEWSLHNAVLMTLQTDPSFAENPVNPDFWFLTKRPVLAKKQAEQDQRGSRTTRLRSGKNFVCTSCGATHPGKVPNAKWFHLEKEILCVQCAALRRHACPICNKVYKHGRQEEDEWIQCDDCGIWIMTKCDVMVGDLSLYDDSNPNHLHYSCPLCRDAKAGAEKAASNAQIAPKKDCSDSIKAAVEDKIDTEFNTLIKSYGFQNMDIVYDEMRAFTHIVSQRLTASIIKQQKEHDLLLDALNKSVASAKALMEQNAIVQIKEHFASAAAKMPKTQEQQSTEAITTDVLCAHPVGSTSVTLL